MNDEKFERLRAWSMTGLHLGLGIMSIVLVFLAISGLEVMQNRLPVASLGVVAIASVGLNLRAAILYGRALKFETALPMQQLGSIAMFVLSLLMTSWFLQVLMESPDL